MSYNKVYISFLVGNTHHLLWFSSLIIKHQQWHFNNFINKHSFLLTFQTVYKYCSSYNLLTDDRKVAGSWNSVLNTSMMKYFKKNAEFQHEGITFLSKVNKHLLSLGSF